MIKVYIACPYTKGDVAINVRNAMAAADILISSGFAPFCPLWFHFQHLHSPHGYEEWMSLDFEWLAACDVVLRLPGESPGAERELEFAKQKNIEIFYDLNQLIKHYEI
ncbi:MAG: hypothetical protein UV51_C0007G0014 [Candidatus Woesebacteria bacterium GW2011_GWC1_42_9]|nr:MAG: hypothetical protein UV51_C0007G0014 [Candidatus Woesebacteria bacterium GW2011_GWC1_42_9]